MMGARVRYVLPADARAPGPFTVIEWTVPASHAAPPTLHHHLEETGPRWCLRGGERPVRMPSARANGRLLMLTRFQRIPSSTL
jgi:hypothetical protein